MSTTIFESMSRRKIVAARRFAAFHISGKIHPNDRKKSPDGAPDGSDFSEKTGKSFT